MAEPTIHVEVVYATAECQELISLQVPAGTTALGAVEASGIAQRVTGLDLARCSLGIFGKAVGMPEARQLLEGDRVEIYRPLLVDPKEVRRMRAERAALAKKQVKSI
ncbi:MULTISPECIES: RnfH family protein [unclassified Pseudomonas]|uniref:RnfH family protein n=1 Tax=unclassified Pseudomonas TaxID=196821 RepID=UPI0025DD5D49|nr:MULTISPECIES: RnfH family protein [unclassified Pseudomonas]